MIDIAPTVLEIVGIPAPTHVDGVEQEPHHGFTFADSLSDPAAPERHTQQYFEAVGNRAMYKDGWWLAMRLPRIPWLLDPEALRDFGPGWNPDDDPVELYYLPDDFGQANDLAATHPEKVEELRKLFWEEADRYQVLPILGGLSSFYGVLPPTPKESKFTYRGRIENVPPGLLPHIYNHSYTISADLVVPQGGVEGVILAAFDHLGGFALYVQDGKLKHHYSMLGVLEYTQASVTPLPSGDVNVELIFAADAPKPATGGEVTLLVNGEPVGSGRMEHTVPSRFNFYAGMDIGCDNGNVVDLSYADKAPFRFTGEIQAGRVRHRPADERGGRESPPRARGPGPGDARGERLKDAGERSTMSDNEQLDVLIAVYLIPDLAQEDFDAYVKLAGDGEIVTDGVALVVKDAEGEVQVQETGDHLGRKGVTAGAGVGLVIGLFAPPLLAATVVGGAVGGLTGKFARHRMKAGIGDKLDDALPPGSAGIIAIYEHDGAAAVAGALSNAIRTSTAQIDKASAAELKEGLKEASAGLAG